jgi:hypothetical protein
MGALPEGLVETFPGVSDTFYLLLLPF